MALLRVVYLIANCLEKSLLRTRVLVGSFIPVDKDLGIATEFVFSSLNSFHLLVTFCLALL